MPGAVFGFEHDRYVPSEHARGPWDPQALHGGAPAGLIAGALEELEPEAELVLARLSFEFLRPVPLAPLSLSARVVRAGRRVQRLEAELRSDDGPVCLATALRVRRVPDDLPPAPEQPDADPQLPGPEHGQPRSFTLDASKAPSFAGTAMEMRWLSGSVDPGPAKVWMRLRRSLLPGRENSALMRLVAVADFGNGVSAALPWSEYVFVNADLSIQLHRPPVGEWIALDAHTRLVPDGCGLAESVLYDRQGQVGRAQQTLVVQRR